jgi:hypothetical protein
MKTAPLPPDPDEQNDSRADHARKALQLFASLTGTTDENAATQVQDLLCDLMHYADRTDGLDFAEALTGASWHYEAETEQPEADCTPPPAAPLFWYCITGRLPGSDEDSALIFRAASREEAMDAFRAEMQRGEPLDLIMAEYGETLIISHVLQSSTEISAS